VERVLEVRSKKNLMKLWKRKIQKVGRGKRMRMRMGLGG
jgi:hypothetical protein